MAARTRLPTFTVPLTLAVTDNLFVDAVAPRTGLPARHFSCVAVDAAGVWVPAEMLSRLPTFAVPDTLGATVTLSFLFAMRKCSGRARQGFVVRRGDCDSR